MTELEFEIVEPNPSALIESLRSFGYSLEAAVADLIDNSITAGATEVGVEFTWNGPESTLCIADNGCGMTSAELRDAMRPGSLSPLEPRSKTDLGRFGLGLKTASFSQSRKLIVASRAAGEDVATRRWDLDHVGSTGQWRLLLGPTPASAPLIRGLEDALSGTVIVWENLDRLVDERPAEDADAQRHFFDSVAMVERHLGMVFHKFLDRRGGCLSIAVNGNQVRPWDPFLAKHPATQKLPKERLTTPAGRVEIEPFILPHHSRLTTEAHRAGAGVRGWNAHQGFYIYRADRLLVSGTWFHSDMKAEEHHKLARISIDISQEMDQEWDIDVRKSRARPPAALRDDLRRIARATRTRAGEVYRHRGKRISKSAKGHEPVLVWQPHRRSGQVTYRVNRDHEVVKLALDLPADQRRRVRALIDLIERTVPVPTIAVDAYERPDEQANADEVALTPDLVTAARLLMQKFLAAGEHPDRARARVLALEPFAAHPELAAAIDEEPS